MGRGDAAEDGELNDVRDFRSRRWVADLLANSEEDPVGAPRGR
jgi:hypothetical protein